MEITEDLTCHLAADNCFHQLLLLKFRIPTDAMTARGHKEQNMITTAPQHAPIDGSVTNRVAGLVSRVMQQTDDLVIVLEYSGKDGLVTRRVLSPIRFVGTDRFLALCLSREEPRQFYLSHCRNVRVDLAANYIMPVALQSVLESN